MNYLINFGYGLLAIASFYGLLILMYLWIFGGTGPLDNLPFPDNNREDSKEEKNGRDSGSTES